MNKRHLTFGWLLIGILTACGGIEYERPQKDITYTGPLTPAQKAAADKQYPFESRLIRKKRAEEAYEARAKALQLSIIPAPTGAAFAGLGFIPNSAISYAVYRDGTAVLLDASGKQIKLDKLVDRVDRVFLAGPHRKRIIGISGDAIPVSWNASNLSQQLVLGPEKRTFGRKKLYDAKRLINAAVLATAVEGNKLELWSLVSGQRIASIPTGQVQPRQIAENSTRNRIIFGTNSGEVRIWSGGPGSRLLYRHAGPLLKIKWLPKRRWIVSVAKDGTMLIYQMQNGNLIDGLQFPRAVYEFEVSDDERWLTVIPAVGKPTISNLNDLRSKIIEISPQSLSSTAQFSSQSEFLAITNSVRRVRFWNTQNQRAYHINFTPNDQGYATDVQFAEKANIAAVKTSNNLIEYWDTQKMDFIGSGLTTLSDIIRYDINSDGKWLLAGLKDGTLVRLRLVTGDAYALALQK